MAVKRYPARLVVGSAAELAVENLTAEEIAFASDTGDVRVGLPNTARADFTSEGSEARAAGSASYVPISSLRESITYNADGTVATVTETDSGAVTTYAYNADGTPATESRVLGGVTTLRTFTYTAGNLTGVA